MPNLYGLHNPYYIPMLFSFQNIHVPLRAPAEPFFEAIIRMPFKAVLQKILSQFDQCFPISYVLPVCKSVLLILGLKRRQSSARLVEAHAVQQSHQLRDICDLKEGEAE
jgi:hypothetical protein